MNINKTGDTKIAPQQPGEATAVPEKQAFQATLSAQQAESNPTGKASLKDRVAGLDLQDPAQLQTALHECLTDIMTPTFEQNNVTPAERQALLEWMRNDPSTQEMALKYLQRMLQE